MSFALVALVATLSTQAPAPEQPPATGYEQLLARYAGGDYDGAVQQVANQPAETFEAPLEDAWNAALIKAKQEFRVKGRKMTPVAFHQAQDRTARLMVAAILLHTEAALETSGDQVEAQLELARRAAQSLEDTKVEHHSLDSGLIRPEDVAHIVRDWHVLAASVLIARGAGRDVFEFIDKALRRYPKDPELELAFGVFHERQATESVVDVSLARDIYLASVVTSWRHVLMTAADYYDRSLKDGGDSEEARLRLGHVHALLGEERKAQATLGPLAESAATPSIRYLALLFLASLAENNGRRDAAQSRYLQALVLAPDAQAPLLGLSRLQDEAGDEAGARSWLERSFKAVSAPRVDPWWIYGKSTLWLFGDRVGALRKYLRP